MRESLETCSEKIDKAPTLWVRACNGNPKIFEIWILHASESFILNCWNRFTSAQISTLLRYIFATPNDPDKRVSIQRFCTSKRFSSVV